LGNMIYDYLFFKSYQLAQKSKNFDDAPVLGGIWGVMPCSMLNLFTIILVFDAFFQTSFGINKIFTVGKYVFAGMFAVILFLYYKRSERWKKIVAKYENREKKRGRSIHPVIVLITAYILSAILINLAAMYKLKYGIFA